MSARVNGRAVALALAWFAAVPPAFAQGHRGEPPGQIKKNAGGGSGSAPAESSPPATPTGEPGAIVTPTIEARTFGMWIDDATLAPGGSVWVTAAVTRWSAPSAHGLDAPSIGVAAGLTRRAQLSFAVPYSRISTTDGALPGGMGDVYVGMKLLARSPTVGGVGLSMSPTLEILNTPGASRSAGFVLPVSAEAGTDVFRVYGSTGFFTRGALFASGALEVHVSPRASVTASLLRSWSTADAASNDALGLRRTRTDVSATVVSFVHPSVALFGNVGRTISPIEFDSSRFVISGGAAFVVTSPSEIPIRPPR